MFETVGHHTFENRGMSSDIKNAPYPCTDKDSFLGRGYYFWEDNLAFSKHWGQLWYLNKGKQYYIGQTKIKCDRCDFFDLVGVREHQRLLCGWAELLGRKRSKLSNWTIGKIIEILKRASKDPENVFYNEFNYKVIRAADDRLFKLSNEVRFTDGNDAFMDLNPCYIICVISINGIISTPIEMVHASKKA